MPAKAAVLVRHQPDTVADWRRFAAILCMMEVYWRVVGNGHYLYMLLQRHTLSDQGWRYVAIVSTNLVWALVVFGACRSLWRHLPSTRTWLIAGLIASLAVILAKSVDCTVLFTGFWGLGPFSSELWLRLARFIFRSVGLDLLWACILVSLFRLADRGRLKHNAQWVSPAVAWCFGWFIVRVLYLWIGSDPSEDVLTGDEMSLSYTAVPHAARVIISVVPLLAGITVLAGCRISRLLALAMMVTEATPPVFSACGITCLFRSAMDALMISSPYDPTNPLPWPWILFNQTMFLVTFGKVVSLAGPWLLIAIYARRTRMLTFPEDGSPWPRLYCGHCHYNLYGVQPTNCPECGVVLDWSRVPRRQNSSDADLVHARLSRTILATHRDRGAARGNTGESKSHHPFSPPQRRLHGLPHHLKRRGGGRRPSGKSRRPAEGCRMHSTGNGHYGS